MINKNKKGVILILCLWFLSSLSLLSLGFAHRTRLEIKVTGFQQDSLYLLHLAKAGISRVIAELESDKNSYDYLGEAWNCLVPLQEEGWFRDKEWIKEEVEVTYQVADEQGKINLNTAPQELLMGLPGIDEAIALSIIDWRDEDDNSQQAGAENNYYQSLNPPYSCKNAPFDLVSELLAVKGISEEIYFGEDTNGNGLLDPNEDDGSLNPPDDNMNGVLDKGLKDLVTVYGDGLINLNTADIKVLCAIPGVTEEISKAIVEYRSGPDGLEGTADDIAFEKTEDLQLVPGMTEYEYIQLSNLGTLNSNYFTITSRAVLPGGKNIKQVRVSVDRSKAPAVILAWREDG